MANNNATINGLNMSSINCTYSLVLQFFIMIKTIKLKYLRATIQKSMSMRVFFITCKALGIGTKDTSDWSLATERCNSHGKRANTASE